MRIPKYRLHKGSGQALVEIKGKRSYLGPHGSPESYEKYHRLLAEKASGTPAVIGDKKSTYHIAELAAAFMAHVALRYVKNGQQTSEVRSFRVALGPVCKLYSRVTVDDFGPLALTACRDWLVGQGICRRRVNQHLYRIRRMFKWGVSVQMCSVNTWQALRAVEGVRKGQAVDPPPIRAVCEDAISPIKPHVTPQVWAMVQLQLWTGCRPGEACIIRSCDIAMSGDVWEYRPNSHKTEHHGIERVILLGPHAQEVIRPWLRTNLEAYLFSPQEGRRAYFDRLAAERGTAGRQRRASTGRKTRFRDHYSVSAYGLAIERACVRAEIEPWNPNQLRKAAATRIRKEYGIEAARVILGHQSAVTSELYAEADLAKAREAMRRLG